MPKKLSLPVRGAWIEIPAYCFSAGSSWSLPVRGAWIEIASPGLTFGATPVAPRKGSVD